MQACKALRRAARYGGAAPHKGHPLMLQSVSCLHAGRSALRHPPLPQVREGRVGSNSQQLGEAARAAIHAKWQEVMAPVTGCASYQEMRLQINRELGRPFSGGGA